MIFYNNNLCLVPHHVEYTFKCSMIGCKNTHVEKMDVSAHALPMILDVPDGWFISMKDWNIL